jgi:hypothetical protein
MSERAGLEWSLLVACNAEGATGGGPGGSLLATPKEPPAAPSKLDFDDHEMKILAK